MSWRGSSTARLRRRLVFTAALGAAGCGLGVVGSESAPPSDVDAGREGGFRDPSPPVDAPVTDAPVLCDGAPADTPDNCGSCGHDCAGGACVAGRCAALDLLVLPPGQTVRAVAVNSTNLYFIDNMSRTIVRAELDGSTPSNIVTTSLPGSQLAVDDTYLWYTGAGLRRTSATGTDEVLLADNVGGCVAIDPDKTRVYAADFDGDRIVAVPYGGGLATDLLTADAGVSFPWGVAANATHMFFTTSGNDPGRILRRPKADDGGTTTVKVAQKNPNCLAFDEAGLLYWVTHNDGVIHRSKADGSDEVVLATDQAEVTQVAIDEKFLYWGTGNKVRRLAR
ncbi:MAG: hypothetical protein KF764_24225 [Labilithrix sp.]|nr:hypothetical protein [Labilithrix sp.]